MPYDQSLTPAPERAGGRSGLTLDGDGARLASHGRTDVVLTLREPVVIARPLGEPVCVSQIAFAAGA